jgi:UDP-glucose 4-epimerase
MNEGRLCLVTGASGFVGRVLCGKLEGRARVRALFRRDAQGPWEEAVRVDLSVPCDLAPALGGVDTVFHLAGKTDDSIAGRGDAAEFNRVNFEGTKRLFEAAAASGVKRFVYASSVKAMGATAADGADERSPHRPTTPYGESKRAAETVVLSGSGVPHVCVVRASPVYGVGSKGNLARMVSSMSRGMFPPLPDARNARSMVHVEDLAEALVLCADREEANRQVFIVTDGRPYSTREMYEWVCEALGRKPPGWAVPSWVLRSAGKFGDVLVRLTGRSIALNSRAVDRLLGSARYDSTLIEKTLGFKPAWDLKKALSEMVRSGASGP